MAGTFEIRPAAIGSVDASHIYDGNGGFPADAIGFFINNYPVVTLLQAVQALTNLYDFGINAFSDAVPNSFSDVLRLNFSGSCIYLDGSLVPIDFAGLPSGFTPLSASVKIDTPAFVSQPGAGTLAFNLQQGPLANGPDLTYDYPYDFTIPPSMLDLMSNGMGLKYDINITDPADACNLAFLVNLRVEGTYDIEGFDFNMQVPEEPVATGSTVEVTGIDPADVKQILTVDIVYEDGGTQTIPATFIVEVIDGVPTLIITIPDITADEPPVIEILVTSTQFSGSVSLGKLITIYFVNAPGIYTLVPGKTSDTLYDITNGGTVDVKIPNPRFKTGFVGD